MTDNIIFFWIAAIFVSNFIISLTLFVICLDTISKLYEKIEPRLFQLESRFWQSKDNASNNHEDDINNRG